MISRIALVALAACHATPPPPAPSTRSDTCLGAADYTVSHRSDDGHVVIEATARPNGCNDQPPSSTDVLVRIPVPAEPGACPVGALALEHVRGRGTRSLHPEFVASLEAGARESSIEELEDLVTGFGYRGARGFVVSCAPLRWVFVEVGKLSDPPRWKAWDYEPARPADPAAPDSSPAAVAPTPPVTPSGSPSCTPPPLAAKATRWIGRSLATGALPGPSTLETFVLDRTKENGRERVQLVRFVQRASQPPGSGRPSDAPPPTWTCESSSMAEGTIQRERRALVLALTDPRTPADPGTWRCSLRKVRVAAADALRESLPQIDESCKRSTWQRPGALREVLSCEADNREHLIFARGAGVEHVTIDEDDCGDRTAALRAIGRDQAVRIVRRYAPRR